MDRRRFLQITATLAVGGITMTGSIAPESVLWDSHAPVLDQGKIGSCTGNAVTQLLNTDYAMKISGRTEYLAEADAIKVYTLATDDDDFPGNYPQEDTGSTGAFVCEAAMQLGYLTGYQCVAPTLLDLLAALRKQPLIVGSSWMSSMTYPDPSGLVAIDGYAAGGHEYELTGFDMGTSEFSFLNSWSSAWGSGGAFKMKFNDFITLLSGDLNAVNAPIVKPAA